MLPDRPLEPGNALDSTSFQAVMLPFIISLLNLMEGEKRCLTVAVCGDWGTGKTTVLKTLESFFKDYCEFPVLFFEAWKHKHDLNPLISLVSAFQELTEVKEQEELSGEVTQLLRKLCKSFISSFEFSGKVPSLPFLPLEMSFQFSGRRFVSSFQKFKEEYSEELLRAKSKYKEYMETLKNLVKRIRDSQGKREILNEGNLLKEEWESVLNSYSVKEDVGRLLEDTERWFVLLIDDLDRLLPEDAFQFVETLRFYFDIDYTLIVMGVNDRILNNYFLKRIGVEGEGFSNGENFFEKIFQWSYELSYERLNELHLRDLKKILNGQEIDQIKEILTQMVGFLSHRKWIKLINRIEKKLRSYKNKKPDLKKLVILAVIKELFPEIEFEMRRDPEIADEVLQGKIDKIRKFINDTGSPFLTEPFKILKFFSESIEEQI